MVRTFYHRSGIAVFVPAEGERVAITHGGREYVVKGVRNFSRKEMKRYQRRTGQRIGPEFEWQRIRCRGRVVFCIRWDGKVTRHTDGPPRYNLGRRIDRRISPAIGEPFPASELGGLDAIPRGTRRVAPPPSAESAKRETPAPRPE